MEPQPPESPGIVVPWLDGDRQELCVRYDHEPLVPPRQGQSLRPPVCRDSSLPAREPHRDIQGTAVVAEAHDSSGVVS